MEDYIIKIALKIKNNDWVDYEKDFRIHEYKAYSDASYWNSKLNSWGGSYMANPTGIYCKEDSPLYVFVNDEIPDDATLYFEGCIDNKLIYGANKGTRLKKGLNVIEGKQDALYYVLYTADTKAQTKKLSEWPLIKIHVEGGTVNGYYDVSLHTDSDYKKILENATYKLFTVKGVESIFNFKTETYRTYWPQTIEKSIRWFDSLTVREKEVIGICDSVASGKRAGEPLYLTGGESFFPDYYNNPNFAIEGESSDAGYANATNYRTSYNSSGCCSKSFDVTRSDFDDWCAAHECGHLNQVPINMEGCGEVSNNLFSNIIRFSDGFTTTSGSAPSAAFKDYANHVPFFTRDIWSMTRMYWQLYLYYHLAQKNTSFYPEIYKVFRADPMKHWNDMNQSSLKFVRTVCQVAQEDLTDFFTIWGFFEPCTDLSVDGKTLTVLQEDIDATLAEISKYPKKNRGIIFIEDRVQKVPTSDFLTEPGNVRSNAGSDGQYGDLGQFTDYLSGILTRSSYTYVQSGSNIALEGSGGVGFEILDESGKLIFASNSRNFALPESLGNDVVQKLGTKYKIYSVDADGTLHLVNASGNGDESVEVLQAGTLSSVLNSAVIRAKIKGPLNGTDIKYLRKLINERNLIAIDFSEASFVSDGEVYYTLVDESKGTSTDYTAVSDNKIGEYAFARCSKLNSVILPSSVTEIGRQAFCNTGLKKVEIP
ncbi:MAG: M60 family metallopeptidase, partial [Treponema sp.]|nr:M60 family metallopeptidase [Treponema sp.]